MQKRQRGLAMHGRKSSRGHSRGQSRGHGRQARSVGQWKVGSSTRSGAKNITACYCLTGWPDSDGNSLSHCQQKALMMRGMKYWWVSRKTKIMGGTAFMMGILFRYCQSDTTQRGDRAERDSDIRLSTAKKLRICGGQSSSSF